MQSARRTTVIDPEDAKCAVRGTSPCSHTAHSRRDPARQSRWTFLYSTLDGPPTSPTLSRKLMSFEPDVRILSW